MERAVKRVGHGRRAPALAVVLAAALALGAVGCEGDGGTADGRTADSDEPWDRVEDFDREAEELRIRSLGETWSAAVEQGDLDWITDLYTEDATLMVPGQMRVEGQDEARRVWSGFLQQPQLRLTINPEQIHFSDRGDLAYDVGTYRVIAEGPETGEPVADEGQYLIVWRRVDGDWKVAADAFRSTRTGIEVPPDSLPPLDGARPEWEGAEGDTGSGPDRPDGG